MDLLGLMKKMKFVSKGSGGNVVNLGLSVFNLREMVGPSRGHTMGKWREGLAAQKYPWHWVWVLELPTKDRQLTCWPENGCVF